MTRVYWDTMLFAYWLEPNPEFGPRIRAIRQAMRARGDQLCASTLSLCELLVLPQRLGDHDAQRNLEALFRSPWLELLPLSLETAPRFAAIRAAARVAAVDALHLAIAASAGVNLFLTNDRQLQRLHVPGIDFIAGLDVPFY